MNNVFRYRLRLAVFSALVVSVLAHLTGGLRADATGVFTYSFNIGADTRGGAPGQFVYPSGMTAGGPNNQIYVADSQNNRVQVFSSSGTHLATFGTYGTGIGEFDYPTGIAVDAVGNILVADNANHRIQMFDASYNYVGTFGSFGNFDVLDPVNLNPETGNYIGPTPTLSGLNWPSRVTLLPGTQLGVANSGLVVISDSQNHRIIVLDSTMTPLFDFGVAGSDGNGPGEFDYPMGVGVDASRIYVTDPSNHQVQIFTYNVAARTATLETSFGGSGPEHSVGDLAQPYDVQPDGQGHLVVVDRDNSRVLYLTPDPSVSLTPRCSDVPAAAAAGRCTIVTTDAAQTRYDALVIGGFTSSGTDNGQFTHPQAAMVDALGRLVVLDTEGSRVVVFRAAHLAVQPVTLDQAGPVQSGQTVTMTVTVVNDGAAPLTVRPTVTPSLAGTLSIPPALFMNPGDSQSFFVTFVTDASGVLNFGIAASGQPAIGHALTAAAVSAGPITVLPAPGSKMSLSVSSSPSPVGLTAAAQVTLTVSNTGTSALNTVTPSIDVAPASRFTFTTMTASSSGPLLPMATRAYTFNYTAAEVGTATFTGSATATYTDIALPSGTGTIATPAGTGPVTSITVTSDAQPPATSIFSVSPASSTSACLASPGTNWYLDDVTVVLKATDNTTVQSIHFDVSGLVPFSGDSNGPTATITLPYDGVPKLTYYAVDTAGNREASHEIVFCIDSVAPTIAKSDVNPAPNSAGWNNSPPEVKFSSKDDTSGQAFVTPPTTVSTQGAGQIVHGLARDGAGNSATTDVIVNVDLTAPVVTCAPTVAPTGLNGWYKQGTSSVTVVCTATDQTGLSGIAVVRAYCPATTGTTTTTQTGTPTFKTGPPSASASCVVSAEGISSVHGDATDVAGNTGITQPLAIKIDRTPPTVTCGTASGGEIWPPNHKMVLWNTSVLVTDLVSLSAGFKLTAFSSTEAVNWKGDGNTNVDMTGWTIGTPDVSGFVRAERSGLGTGRNYRLLYEGMDGAGNVTQCTNTLIGVPHDQGKK